MQTTGTEPIQIVVNGEDHKIPGSCSVRQLLDFLELDPERVAVEMNRMIVRRPAWSTTPVPGGATFEIVQFVGGG
jgi:sulfur carrier protein